MRAVRREGGRITAETITPFLGISSDDAIGFLAKMVPPVRTPEHRAALWEAIRDGTIDTVGTDNTSRRRASKRPEAGLHGSRPGHPSLGTHLPVLLHHGRRHGIALERLVDLATRAPARAYGIFPRKGTIAPGSDADLVVVDLELEKVVRAEDLRGMSDFSPFEGTRLAGCDHQGRQARGARRRDRRRTERPLPSPCGALAVESAAHMIQVPGF